MSGGIFISYRREDSDGFAGRIYDRLAARLGRERVFIDVDNIPVGLDFVEVLSERVGACDVLLAIVGRHWAEVRDSNGDRRLDDPHDFVRIEIEAALTRNIRVVPVFVGGANFPRAEVLPETLRPLLRRNGLQVSHDRFDSDAERLIKVLAALGEEQGKRGAEEVAPMPVGAEGQADQKSYYFLVRNAVEGMPEPTPAARRALYARARKELREALETITPPIGANDFGCEFAKLDRDIWRLEGEIVRREAPGAPPPRPPHPPVPIYPEMSGGPAARVRAAGSPKTRSNIRATVLWVHDDGFGFAELEGGLGVAYIGPEMGKAFGLARLRLGARLDVDVAFGDTGTKVTSINGIVT